MHQRARLLTLALAHAIVSMQVIRAQAPASPHLKVDVIKVHGVLLEGNLDADPSDRQVSVYLPPRRLARSTPC